MSVSDGKPPKHTTRKFGFSAEAEDRLQVLMDKINAPDVATVLRGALRLYEWAVEEVEAGKQIASIDSDGKAECINVHPDRRPSE